MSCKMCSHSSHVVILLLVLLLTDFSCAMSCDFSTKTCINPNEFVKEGHRMCFRSSVNSNNECEEFRYIDSVDPVPLAKRDDLTKVASPNFLRGGQYKDNTLCEYHVPQCQRGYLLCIMMENFKLQQSCKRINGFMCPDFVDLTDSTFNRNQLVHDICNVFCGKQPAQPPQMSSQGMKVTFRSNDQGTNRGFRIDLLCAEAPTKDVSTDPVDSEAFRFRRQVEEDKLKEDTEILYRGKRFVVSPTFRISEDCVELGGFSPPPIPIEPIVIPQNGSEVNLPNGVCLTYRDKVLTVFQRDVPLRTFRNISRLFFWTSFNGTRVFEGSARVPADEIFGGGRLLIVGDCAYYVTYLSPPRYNPNSQEVAVIGFLLDASDPFFVDQDIIDDGSTLSTAAPPSATRPPPRSPTRNKKGYSFVKGYRPFHHKPTTPPPPEIDSRINIQAVRLALRFENACNIFLRQAAKTFLSILKDEGLLGPPLLPI